MYVLFRVLVVVDGHAGPGRLGGGSGLSGGTRDREREEPWRAEVAYPLPLNTWSRLAGKWILRVGRKGGVSRLAGPAPLSAPLHVMVNGYGRWDVRNSFS